MAAHPHDRRGRLQGTDVSAYQIGAKEMPVGIDRLQKSDEASPTVQRGHSTALDNVFIQFNSVTKAFARRGRKAIELQVLRELSFNITKGEFVSIIGPSGCGKTTALNLLAGLDVSNSGSILVDGQPVRGPSAQRGMVFQQDAIFPWRTVKRNVEYGMEMAGIPRSIRKARCDHYLELVGLMNFRDYYPAQLSGGMKKRVAIATVLANKPSVLLMDEPFGALDYPTRIRLQDQLLSIWDRDQVTTVFVTHDIEEALYLSDRILVLADAGLAEEYFVPFDRPRDPALRTSPEMQEAKAQLWKYL